MSQSMILILLAWTAFLSPAGPDEFVFETAPFTSSHASTIVELANDDLMVAWFGGSAEGKPDVAIWGAIRVGGRWSAPAELVREPGIATYNPVLFHTKDGKLWLYYKFGPHPTAWTGGRMWSSDEGRTWSKPEHLPAGLYGPVRTKPLVLDDGTIVSGTSVESYRSWACWIERSTDSGHTWAKAGPIVVDPRMAGDGKPKYKSPWDDWDQTDGIIQPSIVPLGGKRLRLYARSTSKIGRICIADSPDLGVTWTKAQPLDLPNPNSGIDAVRLADSRVVLVYNHTLTGRSPLNLAISTDGASFRMFKTLVDKAGEYSYPAMIAGRDGALHITYTWNRKQIRYVRIPRAEIPR
jgi:predicted neuraminidase